MLKRFHFSMEPFFVIEIDNHSKIWRKTAKELGV